MVGAVGTQRVRDLTRLWSFSGPNPISHADYEFALQNGRFPGEVAETAPQLNNYATDPGAELRDELVELIGKVELYIDKCGRPLSDEAADSLANYLDMIRSAEVRAGKQLLAELAEQKAEITRRRAIWETSMDEASRMASRLRDLLTPFLRAKKALGLEPKIGGQSGKRVSLRPIWKARVTNWDLVMAEYHNDAVVRAEIQKMLDARARSKDRDNLAIAGAEFYQDEVAV